MPAQERGRREVGVGHVLADPLAAQLPGARLGPAQQPGAQATAEVVGAHVDPGTPAQVDPGPADRIPRRVEHEHGVARQVQRGTAQVGDDAVRVELRRARARRDQLEDRGRVGGRGRPGHEVGHGAPAG